MNKVFVSSLVYVFLFLGMLYCSSIIEMMCYLMVSMMLMVWFFKKEASSIFPMVLSLEVGSIIMLMSMVLMDLDFLMMGFSLKLFLSPILFWLQAAMTTKLINFMVFTSLDKFILFTGVSNTLSINLYFLFTIFLFMVIFTLFSSISVIPFIFSSAIQSFFICCCMMNMVTMMFFFLFYMVIIFISMEFLPISFILSFIFSGFPLSGIFLVKSMILTCYASFNLFFFLMILLSSIMTFFYMKMSFYMMKNILSMSMNWSFFWMFLIVTTVMQT